MFETGVSIVKVKTGDYLTNFNFRRNELELKNTRANSNSGALVRQTEIGASISLILGSLRNRKFSKRAHFNETTVIRVT